MHKISKRILVLLGLVALVACAAMGCHTANGFGKDVENAGHGIQNGTK